jgi:hypothetical protein
MDANRMVALPNNSMGFEMVALLDASSTAFVPSMYLPVPEEELPESCNVSVLELKATSAFKTSVDVQISTSTPFWRCVCSTLGAMDAFPVAVSTFGLTPVIDQFVPDVPV